MSVKKVVSVSLGSHRGDKSVTANILGHDFEISRVGTNGSFEEFAKLVRELDGNVDAISLGGIDLYLYADGRRYTIRDAAKLASNAKKTSVVDGSGIKNTIERETIDWIQRKGLIDFPNKNILVVSGVDRFGMAESVANLTNRVIFGDMMFSIGIPHPIRSLSELRLLARTLLPIICVVPFKWLYPVGEAQDKITPKYEEHFRWADVIAGDYKYIGRFMPPPTSNALVGKTIISNTLTAEDVQNLKDRGVKTLITSTLEFDGRFFGTNVLEGIVVAISGKRPEEMKPQDYLDILHQMDWEPTVRDLGSNE
jgi:hypothetical protein